MLLLQKNERVFSLSPASHQNNLSQNHLKSEVASEMTNKVMISAFQIFITLKVNKCIFDNVRHVFIIRVAFAMILAYFGKKTSMVEFSSRIFKEGVGI